MYITRKIKQAIAIGGVLATITVFAFPEPVEIELNHECRELPNERDHERAAEDSKDGGYVHFDDVAGCPHDYIDGREVH